MKPATSPQAATELVVSPASAGTRDWERDAAGRFARRMLDHERPFPCVFGVDALRRDTLRFSFIPRGPAGHSRLSRALREYVAIAPSLGRRTSLVAFLEPDPRVRTLNEHHQRFWELLQALHDSDREAWPNGIPRETENSRWEFSCAGMPMFVVANTPAHNRRASRHFDYFTVTFQPRFVFDDLTEDSAPGRRARKIIRRRLDDYDEVERTPLLGGFGAAGNREWTQYFLDDDNDSLPIETQCPLHIRASREETR